MAAMMRLFQGRHDRDVFPAMAHYPIEVATSADEGSIRALCERFNDAQSVFRFQMAQELSMKLCPERREGLSVHEVIGRVEKFRSDEHGYHPFVVVVISDRLSDDTNDSMNMSYNASRGIALCTCYKWPTIARASIHDYYGYVLAHAAAIFAFPSKLMHKDELNCLFDRAISKTLKDSMGALCVCPSCAHELSSYTNRTMTEAVIALVGALAIHAEPKSTP